MKKIGVFAGVFDPIHLGHTEFIKKAVKEHGLDKVYVLVEQEPKFKTCLAGYEHRKKMAELATEHIGEAEIYDASAKSFPITSTLPEIKNANPDAEIFLLLGDDVAEHINEWQAKEILEGVELIVAKRNQGEPLSRISSLKIRQNIQDNEVAGLEPKVLDYIRAKKLY